MNASSKPASKFIAVTRRTGVVGYIEVFRTGSGQYVSVPGASRWMDLAGNVRAI